METNYRSFQSQSSLRVGGFSKVLATEQPSLTLERPRRAVGGDMDVLVDRPPLLSGGPRGHPHHIPGCTGG